ncbi:uncharacterized protein EI90DRAFT_2251773 [Cantharellus anzutake]|uniref:uncharacterized protein n=1 Tax=Cantharellus anzutake TaxID=1750568 RepID=UPI0019043AEC|nr:uncharacterized protein EI90DRAFT_2251773 [Cantharellus anzutake]KAF8339557.1 hypothetical protein EI90DRAFT_2251773 [Cantharellus anzutake]
MFVFIPSNLSAYGTGERGRGPSSILKSISKASGLGFELWLRPPYIFTIPSSCDQIVALEFPNLQPTKSPIQTLTAQSHTFEISLTGLNLLEHTPHPETGHVFNYSPIDHWISYNDAKQLSLRRRVLGQLDFIPSFNSPPIYVVIDSTDDVPRVIYRCSENRMRSNRSFVVPIDRVTGNDSGTDTFICVAGDFATPAPQVSRRIAAAVAVVDDAMNPPQGAVQVAVNAGLDLREGVVEMGYQPLYASLWTKKEDDRVFGEKSSLEQELKVGRTSPGPSKMSTSSLFPTPSQFAVSDTPSSQSSSSHSSSSPDPRDLGYNMTQAQFAFDGGSTKQGIVHGGPCPISGRMIVEIREPFQYALLEFD